MWLTWWPSCTWKLIDKSQHTETSLKCFRFSASSISSIHAAYLQLTHHQSSLPPNTCRDLYRSKRSNPPLPTRRSSRLPASAPPPTHTRHPRLRPAITLLQRPQPRVLLRLCASSGLLSQPTGFWPGAVASDRREVDGAQGRVCA